MYTLNDDTGTAAALAAISSSRGSSGPKFGATMCWRSTLGAPPAASASNSSRVRTAWSKGSGSSSGDEAGTFDSMATVVSLARNMPSR